MKVLTKDNVEIELNEDIVKHSFLLSNKIFNNGPTNILVDSITLFMIIDVVKMIDICVEPDYLPSEVTYNQKLLDYLNKLSSQNISLLIEAADYLYMPLLLDYLSFTITNKLKHLQTKELINIFKNEESLFEKKYKEKIKLKKNN